MDEQIPQDDVFEGFEAPQNLPDTPMSNMSNEILKTLLDKSEVPAETKKDFWFAFMNDTVLTFIDDEGKRDKMMDYDIIKLEKLKSIPYTNYDFKTEEMFSIMRHVIDNRLDRSRGFKGDLKNERTLQQSQFTEQKIVQEANVSNQSSSGSFFKNLFSRGGKR